MQGQITIMEDKNVNCLPPSRPAIQLPFLLWKSNQQNQTTGSANKEKSEKAETERKKERKKDHLFSQQQQNTEHTKLFMNNQNHFTYI
jgi:hypothetical protein